MCGSSVVLIYGDDLTFAPGAFPLTATQSTARTRRIWANMVSNTTVDSSGYGMARVEAAI